MTKNINDIIRIGKSVLIRTATFHYIGTIQDMEFEGETGYFVLNPAVWLADSGRFSTALRTGTIAEYEVLPDGVIIFKNAAVDMMPWNHPVPTEDQ